jgi:hypothetical protein
MLILAQPLSIHSLMVTLPLQADHGKLLLTQELLIQVALSMSTNTLFNMKDSKTSLLGEMPSKETSQEPIPLLLHKIQLSKTTF